MKLQTKTHWMCEKPMCDGEIIATGISIDSMPPTYPHVCDKCGAKHTANIMYPAYVPPLPAIRNLIRTFARLSRKYLKDPLVQQVADSPEEPDGNAELAQAMLWVAEYQMNYEQFCMVREHENQKTS